MQRNAVCGSQGGCPSFEKSEQPPAEHATAPDPGVERQRTPRMHALEPNPVLRRHADTPPREAGFEKHTDKSNNLSKGSANWRALPCTTPARKRRGARRTTRPLQMLIIINNTPTAVHLEVVQRASLTREEGMRLIGWPRLTSCWTCLITLFTVPGSLWSTFCVSSTFICDWIVHCAAYSRSDISPSSCNHKAVSDQRLPPNTIQRGETVPREGFCIHFASHHTRTHTPVECLCAAAMGTLLHHLPPASYFLSLFLSSFIWWWFFLERPCLEAAAEGK